MSLTVIPSRLAPKSLTRFALSAGILALVAACGGSEPQAAVEDSPTDDATQIVADTAALPPTIAITDNLGQFDGDVAGIALWQHPTQSFRSAVLAANGEAGLYLVPLDRSAPVQVPGDFTGGVAIGYTDTAAIAAAYDAQLGGVRFYSVDPATRELAEFASAAAGDGAKALCFVGDVLVRIGNADAVYRHGLTVGADGIAVTVDSVPGVQAVDCAGTKETGYLLSAGGRVLPISPDGTIGASLAAPRDAIAIAAFETAEGVELAFAQSNGGISAGGTLALIGDEAGPLGVARLTAGSGNFGGPYRGGALGFVSSENDLGVVSWLAIANALGAEGATISPQGADAGVGADLAGERTSQDGELDTSLDEEAQERLEGFRSPPGGGQD